MTQEIIIQSDQAPYYLRQGEMFKIIQDQYTLLNKRQNFAFNPEFGTMGCSSTVAVFIVHPKKYKMQNIISENALFILFLVIVFVVWVITKYSPKMENRIAELDVQATVERLEYDILNARDIQQLDKLEKFIDVAYQKAKATTGNAPAYYKRLIKAYNTRFWDLVNTEAPGLPQELIPFISNY